MVWEAVAGTPQNDEIYKTLMPLGDDQVIVAGEVKSAGAGGKQSLMLAVFDRRGKNIWEKAHVVEGLHSVVKILPAKDGYVVVANRRKKGTKAQIWLGYFKSDGVFDHDKILSDPNDGLQANDAAILDDKQIIFAVTVFKGDGMTKSPGAEKIAAIYVTTREGGFVMKRDYILGRDNEIFSLFVSEFQQKKVGIIATGYFENDFHKKIGWVLRLEKNASLVWQKEFVKGAGMEVRFATGALGKDVVISGDILPLSRGKTGTWLASLNAEGGNLQWQRYYEGETGVHDYRSGGLFMQDSGLITLVMEAKAESRETKTVKKEDKSIENQKDVLITESKEIPSGMDYVHVLTVSPRGITMSGDSYYHGLGASVSQVVAGHDGQRLMAGFARVKPREAAILEKAVPEESPAQKPINLPDAKVSEKALTGLELLNKNMSGGQKDNSVPEDKEKQLKSGESNNTQAVNKVLPVPGVSRDGWVFSGAQAQAYKDPCAEQ